MTGVQNLIILLFQLSRELKEYLECMDNSVPMSSLRLGNLFGNDCNSNLLLFVVFLSTSMIRLLITCPVEGPSWPWSYGSWIYNYICNQWLSPLMLWVRISIRASCTTLCDKVCQWLSYDKSVGFFRVLRFPPPIKLTTTI